MRILISADAEGVTGADELLPGKPRWEWMRGMMTDDADAGPRAVGDRT
ncbi:MAG: M55 family metallopeptidase [Thermomicrobiales bacterium]